MIDVNAHGTFNGTLAALELMRPAGRGHIINIVSLAGLVAAPGEALYAASKHAAIAFTIGTLHGPAALRHARRSRLGACAPTGSGRRCSRTSSTTPTRPSRSRASSCAPRRSATAVDDLLDRPRPVLTVPRRRGAFVRFFDAFPGLAGRLVPLVMADARRRQQRWKRRIEAGRTP